MDFLGALAEWLEGNSLWLTPLLLIAGTFAGVVYGARHPVVGQRKAKEIEREDEYRADMRSMVKSILAECVVVGTEGRNLADERLHTTPELRDQFRTARALFEKSTASLDPELARLSAFAQEDDVVEAARELRAAMRALSIRTATAAGNFWQGHVARALEGLQAAKDLADDFDAKWSHLADLSRNAYRPTIRDEKRRTFHGPKR